MHVVDAAGDPVVAVVVAAAAVAGEVLARIGREIGLRRSARGRHRPCASGPASESAMHEIAFALRPSSTLPSASTTSGCTPKNGSVAEPGFRRWRPAAA